MEWKLKLKALLHDPPYKMLIFENGEKERVNKILSKVIHKDQDDHNLHEIWAEDLLNYVFFDECIKDNNIELADKIASAQSRIIVKPQFRKEEQEREKNFEIKSTVNFSEVEFIDIFSEEKNKCETPDPIKVKDLFTKLGNLNFLNEEERAKLIFLFLWRFYPEIFPEITKHPADSRAPNHSIYDHLVQTSAVFSALPNISFLLFTIGPVQSFIVKARKTSDLWAGSYLLSYLTWESMKPIIEKYGPDTVIYPNLLEQPLVDKHLFEIFKGSSLESLEEEKFKEWITKWQSKSKELKESLVIANMPNRFLAIVPMDKEIGKGCEDNFKEKLKRLSDKVYKTVKNYDRKKEYPSNLDLRIKIEKQLFSYFQVYWVMMPWGKETNDILKEYKLIIGETEVCQTISEIINHPYYKYSNADVGSAYSLLLELTEKLIGMRKSVREFAQLEQPDEKCHLCGEFEVLNLDWDKLKKEKPGLIKENERLCGVCFTKRLFPQILKDELNLSDEIYFPSTSEIASIGEKRRLNNEVKKEFKVRFDEFKSKFKIPLSASVPKLKEDLLYDIDGQYLMKETYRIEYFEKELGIEVKEEDFKDILDFLDNHNINPSKYYAILKMDGDNIGKWLKGDFNPKVKDTIHPKVKDALLTFSEGEDRLKLQKILCSKHLVSPSLHQAFSRRLSIFALEHVKKIIEDRYFGKLVYAGGDDILALLPIEEVLKCAFDLQKTFKEVLSPKASMSAGIVIVHHKYPLYLALNDVNIVEKKAKNNYGKDAFCLEFLRHSGERKECGGKWSLISFIEDLICKFRNKDIPSRFPYEYLQIVENLCDENGDEVKLREILELELKRVFFRKIGNKKGDLSDYFENTLREKFKELSLKNFANTLVISKMMAEEFRI